MSEPIETYVRWQPVAGLPENPVGAVRFSYDGDKLTVSASYAHPADAILTLSFHVRAFKAYEEQSDPWVQDQPDSPMVENPSLGRPWTWPLQEVRNSR